MNNAHFIQLTDGHFIESRTYVAVLFKKQKHMKGQGLHGLSITVKFFMEFFVVSVISDQATVVDCYRLFFF